MIHNKSKASSIFSPRPTLSDLQDHHMHVRTGSEPHTGFNLDSLLGTRAFRGFPFVAIDDVFPNRIEQLVVKNVLELIPAHSFVPKLAIATFG